MVAIDLAESTSMTVMTPPTSSVTNRRGPVGSGDSLAVPAAAPCCVVDCDEHAATSEQADTISTETQRKDGTIGTS